MHDLGQMKFLREFPSRLDTRSWYEKLKFDWNFFLCFIAGDHRKDILEWLIRRGGYLKDLKSPDDRQQKGFSFRFADEKWILIEPRNVVDHLETQLERQTLGEDEVSVELNEILLSIVGSFSLPLWPRRALKQIKREFWTSKVDFASPLHLISYKKKWFSHFAGDIMTRHKSLEDLTCG